MAQSYLVNSALRMHPIEWSSGVSAGVLASFMAKRRLSTSEVEPEMAALQALLRNHTPLEWTIGGKVWPPAAGARDLGAGKGAAADASA